jgi:hypothetical protein
MGYPVASGMIPYWRGVEADPAASPGQRAMAQAVNRIHTVILSNTEVDIPSTPPSSSSYTTTAT